MPQLRSRTFQPEAPCRQPRQPTLAAAAGAGFGVTVGAYGLILDLDGTLVDSYAAIADSLNHARSRFDLEPLPVQTVRRAVGYGLEHLIERWVGPDRIDRGVELFRERYADVFAAKTMPLPGVDRALRELAASGYALALASNKPARFSSAILRQFDWPGLFETVEGPDTVGTAKPDPAMLRACLRALGTSAPRTRYVGDMPLDDVSARRAGLEAILVRGGSADDSDLRATGAPVLDGFRALPAFVSDLWSRDPV